MIPTADFSYTVIIWYYRTRVLTHLSIVHSLYEIDLLQLTLLDGRISTRYRLLHFSLLYFPPLRSAPAFSTPAFSNPAFSALPFHVRVILRGSTSSSLIITQSYTVVDCRRPSFSANCVFKPSAESSDLSYVVRTVVAAISDLTEMVSWSRYEFIWIRETFGYI